MSEGRAHVEIDDRGRLFRHSQRPARGVYRLFAHGLTELDNGDA